MTPPPMTLPSGPLARAERRVRAFVDEIEPLLPSRAARLLTNALVHETGTPPAQFSTSVEAREIWRASC